MADLQLRAGNAVLAVDTLGGGMRALRVGDWEVLDGYGAGEQHSGRRGHVLAPWPGRIFRGRYAWRGRELELPVTDAKHQSATHGLVDKVEWHVDRQVDRQQASSAVLSVVVPRRDGYPFDVRVRVEYRLGEDGLEVVAGAENLGEEAAPFGLGMHPYFRCGADADETTLSLPVRTRLVLDGNNIPTGEVDSVGGDIGVIGDAVVDAAYQCVEPGAARVAEIGGPAGTLRLELGDSFGWLVVFTGDTLPEGERRRGVAVEPMTCPPNAFATGTDVIAVEPGESWRDRWSLRWSPR